MHEKSVRADRDGQSYLFDPFCKVSAIARRSVFSVSQTPRHTWRTLSNRQSPFLRFHRGYRREWNRLVTSLFQLMIRLSTSSSTNDTRKTFSTNLEEVILPCWTCWSRISSTIRCCVRWEKSRISDDEEEEEWWVMGDPDFSSFLYLLVGLPWTILWGNTNENRWFSLISNDSGRSVESFHSVGCRYSLVLVVDADFSSVAELIVERLSQFYRIVRFVRLCSPGSSKCVQQVRSMIDKSSWEFECLQWWSVGKDRRHR